MHLRIKIFSIPWSSGRRKPYNTNAQNEVTVRADDAFASFSAGQLGNKLYFVCLYLCISVFITVTACTILDILVVC